MKRRRHLPAPPAAAPRSDPFRRSAALIFGVALVVRIIHIWQIREAPFFSLLMGDSRGYDEWARQIAGGDWIGREVFYQAPLYPYFLGLVYTLAGHDLLIVRIVQAGIGALSCVALAYAGHRLISPRVGLLSGLMLALYAPAIFFDALIQKSILDVFFVCVALAIVARLSAPDAARGTLASIGPKPRHSSDARAGQNPRHYLWICLGLVMGALSLTRENAMVFIAVLFVWTIWTTRPGWHRPAILFAAGLAIVLIPIATRNYIVGGGFYVTTSQFGSNFYIGNNPAANGSYMALREGRGAPEYERQDATELAERALGRPLSPSDVSAYWRDRALHYIRAQPLHWLKLLAEKMLLLVSATEMLDTESQESHAEWSWLLRLGGGVGHFGILLPLALVGLLATWPDRRQLWVVYAMAIGYAASVVLFFVFARYRYPLVPFVVLFAAAGVAMLPRYVQQAPRRRQAAVAAAVIAIVVVTQWPVLATDVMRAITETNIGVALHEHGRLEEATAHYRRAVAIRPDYAPGYSNLGVVLRKQGRLDEAIASYRRALEIRPAYADARYNLANALLERGDVEEAAAQFHKALESIGGTAGAHNNLGVALAASGKLDEAIAEFRAALTLEPESARSLRNLGDALARRGRYPEAIEHLQAAVRLNTGDPALHYDLGGVLLEAGRLPEAADQFRESIRLAPEAPQAYNNLGIALAAQGRMEDAAAAFEKAVALKPDFEAAKRNLAKAKK